MAVAYIIQKQGIYGHGVHGVYIGEGAKERAIGDRKLRAWGDRDSHHDWVVVKVEINKLASPTDKAGHFNTYDDTGEGYCVPKNAVYACRKNGPIYDLANLFGY